MISEKVKAIKGSPTLALAAKAGELKAAGEDVISLSVGEPDWDTFDGIKKAAKVAMDEGRTKYTPVPGTVDLRRAIAEQTNRDLNVDYGMENVTVSSGGKYVIFSALQTLIEPGDEVLIPTPYWVSYPEMVKMVGGVPVIVPTKKSDRFKLTARLLKEHLTSQTKMLILNSPSNPTGEVYSKEELLELSEVVLQSPKLVVLSDDIYNRLVFEPPHLAPHILQVCESLKERTIVVNGVSKTYSMTGWRLGWALGPKEVIKAMSRFQSQTTSCASSISQAAAVEAILNSEDDLKGAIDELKSRRDFIFSQLSGIEGVEVDEPQGAFYIWPDISSFFGRSYAGKELSSSSDFAQAFLESKKVATVPGEAFGQQGRLRVSYALKQGRMAEAVERLRAFLGELS